MKSRDFCYWLQGFFELEGLVSNRPDVNKLTEKQVEVIRNHLSMVFKHEIDPSFGDEKNHSMLQKLHSGLTVDAKVNC